MLSEPNLENAGAIKRTYVHPFLDFKRNLVFLGTFLGMYGFALVNTVASYDLGGADFSSLLAFFGPSLLVAGILYWPLLYMGFSAYDSVLWRVFLFVIQLAGLICFTQAPADPLVQGFISGVMLAPFWCTHHIAMVQNTSHENRGYEVSLGMFIAMGSGVLSAVTSGYYLEVTKPVIAITISLVCMMLGTLCFLISMKIVRQHSVSSYIKESWRVAKDNPYMIRRIVSHSFFDIPTLAIAAIMSKVGISPVSMATLLIARLILMAFLSPTIGTVAHKYRKQGYGIGLFLIGAAWGLLAIEPSSEIIFFSFLIVFNFGLRIADGSLMTGLYEMQSYASMMWSEVYMTVGRVVSLIVLMPLLYLNLTAYLIVLALLSLAIFVVNRKWQLKWADAQAM